MKGLISFILPLALGIFTPVVCHSQEEMKPFKLAVAQMRVVGGALDTNLEHAREMIEEAGQQGAQLVLLPEAMDLGWTDPSALTLAEPVPEGKTASLLCHLARKYGIYICSGLTEKDGETVYNSAVLIDPTGKVILLHRKINELEKAGFIKAESRELTREGKRYNTYKSQVGSINIFFENGKLRMRLQLAWQKPIDIVETAETLRMKK